ncbi:BppU family phage baseplate upper protein [Clostridium perfringens]|uniref:BppU family phage baseplate upper protein n=1 Tax=Clostridium perfringens TaxID=1502 RepID=UPI0039EA3D00
MALNDKAINFDINRNNLFNLTAKQYDTTGARSFTFRLLKNSVPFDLTGLLVKVGGNKPDKKDVFNDCNVIDAKKGIVEVDLTTQMQAVAGILNLELIILRGETRLSTVPFEVKIIQSATCYTEVQSSDEFGALNNALILANEYSGKLKEGTENIELQYASKLNKLTSDFNEKEVIKDIKQKKTLISFTSDDGWLEDYTILEPRLSKYNYPMSIALVPGYLSDKFPQYITEAQAKELVSKGWEVVNHSVNNDKLGEINFKKAKYYIDECHNQLTKKGFDVKGIVYPQGSFNDDVLNYVKKIYDFGVSIISDYENNPINTYFINRFHFDDANTNFEYYKKIIDGCEGKWTVFMLHGKYFRTNPELIPVFEQLIEYINSKGYECVTYSQALKYYKNSLFAGNEKRCTKIGVDGSFYSDDILENFTDDKGINQDTPITEFPKDKVTVKVFTTADNVNFPEGSVGELETYRFSKHEDLSFQIWNPAYQYKIYKRIWSTSLKKWLDFKDITEEYTIPVTTTDVRDIEGKLQIRNKGAGKQNELTVCLKNAYEKNVHTKIVTSVDTSLYVRDTLLNPSEEHRGKQVLIQETGVEDKLYTCVRRTDGAYHWKQIQFV